MLTRRNEKHQGQVLLDDQANPNTRMDGFRRAGPMPVHFPNENRQGLGRILSQDQGQQKLAEGEHHAENAHGHQAGPQERPTCGSGRRSPRLFRSIGSARMNSRIIRYKRKKLSDVSRRAHDNSGQARIQQMAFFISRNKGQRHDHRRQHSDAKSKILSRIGIRFRADRRPTCRGQGKCRAGERHRRTVESVPGQSGGIDDLPTHSASRKRGGTARISGRRVQGGQCFIRIGRKEGHGQFRIEAEDERWLRTREPDDSFRMASEVNLGTLPASGRYDAKLYYTGIICF